MKKMFLILTLNLVACFTFGQKWQQSETEADIVEQEPPKETWIYSDEKVLICFIPYDNVFSVLPINEEFDFITTYETGMRLDCIFPTIATFDLKRNRTGYWKNVFCFDGEDHKSAICAKKWQPEGENKYVVEDLWNYIRNKSGSVILRFAVKGGTTIDYRIGTIKTLGYEDKNGRHWDGDIDVIGVR